jgi:hypothetical protein
MKFYAKSMCVLIFLTLAWYSCMTLVLLSDPSLAQARGDLLDLRLLWTAKKATALFESLSSPAMQRLRYFYALDLVLPLLYCPLLAVAIGLFLNIVPGEGLPEGATPPLGRRVIAGLPLAAGIFDIFENVAILCLARVYESTEAVPRVPAMVGGACTMFKWTFLLLPFIVFWYEILVAPRADEEAFDKILAKREGRRDKKSKVIEGSTSKEKEKSR